MKIFLPLTVAASLALVGSLALAQNSHPTGPGGAPHSGSHHTGAPPTGSPPPGHVDPPSGSRPPHGTPPTGTPPTGTPPPKHGHMGMPGGAPSNGPGM